MATQNNNDSFMPTVRLLPEMQGFGTPQLAKMNMGALTSTSSNSSFSSTLGSNRAGQAGGALAGIYDAIPSLDKTLNSADATSSNIRGGVNKALLSGAAGPWGMLAGAINMGIDKTGGFTDASKGLGKGTDTANMVASLAVPGAGWFTKKTDSYKLSDELKQSSGYTGTVETGKTALLNSGAKLLFGRKKANRMIGTQKQRDTLVLGILSNAKDDFASSNNPLLKNRMEVARTGGYLSTAIGKDGMKLELVYSDAKLLLGRIKALLALKFELGGKMNIIPIGALHKENHNLKLEGVTSKGIPVVVQEDGGLIILQAEIEREEIIFTLEVSEALELYRDEYHDTEDLEDKDEAALLAGILLAELILHNTLDKGKLIKSVE